MSLYHIICFTDFVPDSATKYSLGFSLNAVLAVAVGFNSSIVLVTTLSESYHGFKRYIRRKRFLKAKK